MAGEIKCPNCGSTQVATKEEQGFSVGKAVLGSVLLGPLGGVAGGIFGGKKLKIVCLSCGKSWEPGK
jgi:tellurium resistance protein TerD